MAGVRRGLGATRVSGPRTRLAAPTIVLGLLLLGCGGEDDVQRDSHARPHGSSPAPAPPVERAHCPANASNCRVASGRVIYVEAHDPDGDGDAHFVLASADSITGPGISVIDVERGMRPDPLPVRGTEVSAAGRVYPGSYGQRQIQATELHVAGD
jgi:hypothetical protein